MDVALILQRSTARKALVNFSVARILPSAATTSFELYKGRSLGNIGAGKTSHIACSFLTLNIVRANNI